MSLKINYNWKDTGTWFYGLYFFVRLKTSLILKLMNWYGINYPFYKEKYYNLKQLNFRIFLCTGYCLV